MRFWAIQYLKRCFACFTVYYCTAHAASTRSSQTRS